jgi:hypothetical protein
VAGATAGKPTKQVRDEFDPRTVHQFYPPGLAAESTGLTKEMNGYSDTAAKATAPVACDIILKSRTSGAPKRRRRISRETWASLRAAISHQHESLPPHSPRVRPTLQRLRFLETEVVPR